MRWVLYALVVVLAVPFFVGLVIGMCVPLAIGPVRRRLMAHAEAICSTEKRLDAAADPGKIIMDPWYRDAEGALGFSGMVHGPTRFVVGKPKAGCIKVTPADAQAALRDAKRRYDFPPDAGGES
jgi:hypothetical protein